jgi:hypothetical protein
MLSQDLENPVNWGTWSGPSEGLEDFSQPW